MTIAQTILETDVPNGGRVEMHVPNLRHGDVDFGTGQATVDGLTALATYTVDFAHEMISVTNTSTWTWSAGAELIVTWEGVMLEEVVADHETRIDALEAGGGTGGGDVGLTERVDALETKVETHEWQLVGHEGRISTNTTDINSLEARVAALEAVARAKTSREKK